MQGCIKFGVNDCKRTEKGTERIGRVSRAIYSIFNGFWWWFFSFTLHPTIVSLIDRFGVFFPRSTLMINILVSSQWFLYQFFSLFGAIFFLESQKGNNNGKIHEIAPFGGTNIFNILCIRLRFATFVQCTIKSYVSSIARMITVIWPIVGKLTFCSGSFKKHFKRKFIIIVYVENWLILLKLAIELRYSITINRSTLRNNEYCIRKRYWETAEKTNSEKRFCFRYKKVIKRFGTVGYLDKNNWMARQVRDRREISHRIWIHFNIYLWTQFQKFNKIFELNARARVYKSINFKYFLSFVRFKIMTIQKKKPTNAHEFVVFKNLRV